MSHSNYLEDAAWIKREKTEWSPTAKLILAFVLVLLALSPAILGIHWELLLRKIVTGPAVICSRGFALGLKQPGDPGCL